MRGFKKDFGYYIAGVIIPGLINFISIPVLKNLLGTESYGISSLYYNTFLLLIASLAGWLGVSIVRFKTEYNNTNFFYRNIFKLTLIVGLATSVLFAGSVYFLSSNSMLALLVATSFFSAYVHNNMVSITQSNFLSKATLFSESLRTVVFFGLYISLVKINPAHYLEKLFFSLLFGYLLSALFLKWRNKISFKKIREERYSNQPFKFKQLLSYGIPLALFVSCNYMMSFIDKPLLANKFGHLIQGNYQSIYEMLFRGSNIIFAPLNVAAFPYMAKLQNENRPEELNLFIKKLILVELAIFTAGTVGYLLGAKFIFSILKVPNTSDYFLLGLFVLLSAYSGQIANLLQKKLELRNKTFKMFINNIFAVFATIAFVAALSYLNLSFIWYPLGILLGSTVYSFICVYQVSKLDADKVGQSY